MSRQQPDLSLVTIEAVVANVRGNYVVTYPVTGYGDLTTRDSVTFSLPEWRGVTPPRTGQRVKLYNVSLWMRGWRAEYALPITPRMPRHAPRRRHRAQGSV